MYVVLWLWEDAAGQNKMQPQGKKDPNEGRADLLVAIIRSRKSVTECGQRYRGHTESRRREGIALYVFAEDASTNRISSALWLGKYEG